MMGERRRGRWSLPAAVAMALLTIGVALAQNPEPRPGQDNPEAKDQGNAAGKGKARNRRRGPVVPPAEPPKNVRGGAADPLAKGAGANVIPDWPYHLRFKLITSDRSELAARFYPSRLGDSAPVVLLIHERGPGHSSKDFTEPIESLEDKGLADYLQEQDYAVLAIDLRGYGDNPRIQVTDRQWAAMVADLQTAYLFLVERHNLRQLNLAKFGVIAVGDGADLAAAWAASPGGAVSSPGRIGDIGAMVLVSPQEEAQGIRLAPLLSALAPRIPIMLVAGERQSALVQAAEPVITRNPLSKVVLYETRLHGGRLLRFEPKAAKAIASFLEEPVKFRNNIVWEPRFLLGPVAYRDIVPEANGDQPAGPARKAQEPAAKKAEEPAARKKAEEPAARKKGNN